MSTQSHRQPPPPTEAVLPTLNQDGTRRWIRPRLSRGYYFTRRRITAWVLMVIFAAVPWITIDGRQLMLLDILHRQFIFFGKTFYSTDGLLLMLLLLAVFLSVFLITAIFGRAWCGWACPQTVYLEFLFRPIERLFEGAPADQRRLDERGFSWRRFLKHVVFFGAAFFVGNIFLSYFVGGPTLVRWMQRSPIEHPASFIVVALVAGAMYFDFAFFREQLCTVACPYARLQSVLLDKRSKIIGYDAKRGEPRARLKVAGGDCVDCSACVLTCPTGIDIRKGLQLECIACGQCADACDAIMFRLGRPQGLIGYTTQQKLGGVEKSGMRWRLAVYPAALAIVAAVFVVVLLSRGEARIQLLGPSGPPFLLAPDGAVMNPVRLKIRSLAAEDTNYRVRLEGAGDVEVISADQTLTLVAGEMRVWSLFLRSRQEKFRGGRRTVRLIVEDGAGAPRKVLDVGLVGPENGG